MIICKDCVKRVGVLPDSGFFMLGRCEVCDGTHLCAMIYPRKYVIESCKRKTVAVYNEYKNRNMKKTIEMSLETARKMYNDVNLPNYLTPFILENFTKEELEGKKGYTWDESFSGHGYYISHGMTGTAQIGNVKIKTCNQSVFRTEKQALSALAFAQLSHIVERYNQGKAPATDEGCAIFYYIQAFNNNDINVVRVAYLSVILPKQQFLFYTKEDAEISLEVNRQLWGQYWML